MTEKKYNESLSSIEGVDDGDSKSCGSLSLGQREEDLFLEDVNSPPNEDILPTPLETETDEKTLMLASEAFSFWESSEEGG